MNEKVKLPKFMCVWLSGFCTQYPLAYISEINRKRNRGDIDTEVFRWLNDNEANQWLLIDAVRYGYEPEPEPRWGIKVGNCYVRSCEDELIELTKSLPLARVYRKESTEQIVKALGFGEVVDLNKVGKADE